MDKPGRDDRPDDGDKPADDAPKPDKPAGRREIEIRTADMDKDWPVDRPKVTAAQRLYQRIIAEAGGVPPERMGPYCRDWATGKSLDDKYPVPGLEQARPKLGDSPDGVEQDLDPPGHEAPAAPEKPADAPTPPAEADHPAEPVRDAADPPADQASRGSPEPVREEDLAQEGDTPDDADTAGRLESLTRQVGDLTTENQDLARQLAEARKELAEAKNETESRIETAVGSAVETAKNELRGEFAALLDEVRAKPDAPAEARERDAAAEREPDASRVDDPSAVASNWDERGDKPKRSREWISTGALGFTTTTTSGGLSTVAHFIPHEVAGVGFGLTTAGTVLTIGAAAIGWMRGRRKAKDAD